MVTPPERIAALERLARLRADRELHRFAGLRRQMAGLQARIATLEAEVLAGYPAGGAFSLAEARRSHAMTRAAAQDLRRSEEVLLALRPRFEAARQQAVREFGRAEVLAQLQARAAAARRAGRAARAAGMAAGPGGAPAPPAGM